MSADNFFLIRRAGTRYCVSSQGLSQETEPLEENPTARDLALHFAFYPAVDNPDRLEWFDTFEEAMDWADEGWSEYGTSADVEDDISGDTEAARRGRLAELLGMDVASVTAETISDLCWARYV